jgi:hypothetical protein
MVGSSQEELRPAVGELPRTSRWSSCCLHARNEGTNWVHGETDYRRTGQASL